MTDSARVFGSQTLEEAFPDVKPGLTPFGERVVVQIKQPPKKTKGGLILTDYSKETDSDTCQVGKVVAAGPLAFRDRTTGDKWVEGDWYKVGDFVRVPKYLGDRWTVKVDEDTKIVFAVFKDLELIGHVDDPLTMRSHI